MTKRYERRGGRLCSRDDDEAKAAAPELSAQKRPASPSGEQRRGSKAAKKDSGSGLDDNLVLGIQSGDPSMRLECATHLRRLLSDTNFQKVQHIIDTVLSIGIAPSLVEFLQCDEPELQVEATWIFMNIFAGTSRQVQKALNYDVLSHLVRLIDSPNDAACENATSAIGNIAGDSPACRDRVLKAGAMSAVLKALEHRSEVGIRRNAAWAITNLCRGKPAPEIEAAIPILARTIVGQDDSQVLADASSALLNIIDGSQIRITDAFEVESFPRIVELLGHNTETVRCVAARAVAHISMGDRLRVRALLDCGVLGELKKILSNEASIGIPIDACLALAGICDGPEAQIRAVLDSGAIQILLRRLPGIGKRARKWIIITISNVASHGNSKQVIILVEAGCVQALCDFLDDRGVVNIALEGLGHFLRAGDEAGGKGENDMAKMISKVGAMKTIKEMEQSHWNEGVREKCRDIIEKYGALDVSA